MAARFLLPLALLAASAACGAAAGPANDDKPLPALTGRVVDQAGLLPAPDEARLTAKLAALESRTGDQVVAVTVPALHGEPIEEFALRLGNGWGIGRDELDNGVVVVVAPAEKMVRIEVGQGLEGLLTDDKAKAIIDERMIPLFRQARHAEAIETGVDSVSRLLERDLRRPQPRAKREAA